MDDKKQKYRSGYEITAEEMAKAFSRPATKSEEEAKQYILSFQKKRKKTT